MLEIPDKDNAVHLSGQKMFSALTYSSKKEPILKPKKMTMKWTTKPIIEFSRANEQVLNTYLGTLATTMACFRLPQHWLLTSYEKSLTCLQGLILLLGKVAEKSVGV